MNIELLREFCLSLPYVTEDVKWGNDLCFLIGEKMFCVTCLEGSFGVSLKVNEDEFDKLTGLPGIVPAPYLARYKWISIQQPDQLTPSEWEHYIKQSYELIKSRLPKRVIKQIEK